MALDGLARDEQLAGDLLVGVPLGDQPEHLALPRGQLVEFRIERGLDVFRRWRGSESVEDECVRGRSADKTGWNVLGLVVRGRTGEAKLGSWLRCAALRRWEGTETEGECAHERGRGRSWLEGLMQGM